MISTFPKGAIKAETGKESIREIQSGFSEDGWGAKLREMEGTRLGLTMH